MSIPAPTRQPATASGSNEKTMAGKLASMNSWKTGWLLIGLLLSIFFLGLPADGHRSGCHRWHSCPSDLGTYTCGDLGYCSRCPDNQFCLAGQPRGLSEPRRPKTEKSPEVVKEFSGAVVGVSDGDTITVLHNGKGERIRLHGIDCPEKRQAFGNRAKQFTSTLVFGNTVTVQVLDRDRYGRTVGEVLLPDGRSLNRELVKAGFAWWYWRYTPDDETLAQLEREARAGKRGLWADPHPVPPWEWRARRKRERER